MCERSDAQSCSIAECHCSGLLDGGRSGMDCIGFLFSKPFPIRGSVVLPRTISGKSHETDPLAPPGGASSSPPHVARSVWHKPVTSEVTLLTGCLQTHDPCHERSPYRRPDLATSRHRRLLTRNHLHQSGVQHSSTTSPALATHLPRWDIAPFCHSSRDGLVAHLLNDAPPLPVPILQTRHFPACLTGPAP